MNQKIKIAYTLIYKKTFNLPIYTLFVEQRKDIDSSTLYSFKGRLNY